MSSIELAVFDCDGVLADSEEISAGLLVQELTKYSLKLDKTYVYRNFVGKSFPVVAQIIRDAFDVHLPDSFEADYRKKMFGLLSQQLQPTGGVREMLVQLRTPACVASSSSPPRVAHTLELLELADRFGKNVFTASQVLRGKPAPDLFLFAAQKMGVNPAHCLVIEDSLAGVEAGIIAGMQVLRYVGGSHFVSDADKRLTVPPGVPIFDNWSQLFKLVPELKG